ncbi:ATP-dependent DNA helicase RecG [Sulfuricurvum kujiense DSM 16994]|uniref:ATP-dependent DNA helicase RecG n=1 Tax=Sulfuricurvum kujiense (strain ATCC BAA-921 / DSM 16994 / JCM 11577 / YK-1) TaxID=709032 RepID=E4TYK7_SULKY|nr:ATP-dependent DNA helicase RecG [Sulfuricurvum kujiense]ADR32984.1 ATP-dependent DNA helicase RecG [Sulfuricurvum kujiense DSM 16994]
MLLLPSEDAEKFHRLGVGSVTALSLIAPASFEDRRLSHELFHNASCVIDARVEHVVRTPKTLKITFFAHNLECVIEGVIFHPKPYMLHQFPKHERAFYIGKAQWELGKWTIVHPVKISAVGSLVPIYKTPLRADVMRRLILKYVSVENLIADGLPEKIASELYGIHFPDIPKALSEVQTYALKFAELFEYMRRLRLKRRYHKTSYRALGDVKKWIKTLPFALTTDQQNAIADIGSDLRGENAARRMIVGDVGSGKTMVILASVILMHPYRSILMAPTTILAAQLYEEAQKYLPNLRIALVTNATKKAPLEEFDFIIGTHALLHRPLPEAGLVMVDEQHRFGTAQRHALTRLTDNDTSPHYLQFSATPIPRTQAMIDSAHIDVSLIVQTPFTKNIMTRIIHKSDFSALLDHIRSEIKQNHQVLIVYPLVEQSEMIDYQSIDEARGYWEKNFENVYVTHGKDKEKEAVLMAFREKGAILLATTVVEVGISLPRLSTVVIVGAERLGLSTLHQLRGRVSRTGLQGYCYLYTNKSGKNERLESFSRCNSGFEIAALDLKFRSSGDLLDGSIQSGKAFRWADIAEDEKIVREVKSWLDKN